ncbi:MAG: hypothetical protein JWM80_1660 [Cyanobacteria bacterium RYN_339]|nr:hypothetical protein [Cyanobacteria bacterium RYN_339]
MALPACHTALPHAAAPASRAVRALDTADLYPLIQGQRWEYELLQRQNDAAPVKKAMTIALTRVEAKGDTTEATLERTYGSFAPPPTRVVKTAAGVRLSRLADPVDGPSITILKFPLQAGQTWPGRDFGGGNTETIAPQGAEAVDVPAGHFDAQRVDHHIAYANGATDTLSYWYAPGVGLVKMIERITVWQGDQAMHLASTGSLTLRGSAAGSDYINLEGWGFLAAPGAFPLSPAR